MVMEHTFPGGKLPPILARDVEASEALHQNYPYLLRHINEVVHAPPVIPDAGGSAADESRYQGVVSGAVARL